MQLPQLLLPALTLIHRVRANTEKTIFTAPRSLPASTARTALDALCLHQITPAHPGSREEVAVAFPRAGSEHGRESWYLLDLLQPRQRYELRISWVATQPTRFNVDTYTPLRVFETPELLTSVGQFSDGRQGAKCVANAERRLLGKGGESAVLLLRVQAAADYFSTNQSLMREPSPVGVNIVLDRYLLNIFPQSLVPTGLLVVVVAVLSWILSGLAWNCLRLAGQPSAVKAHRE